MRNISKSLLDILNKRKNCTGRAPDQLPNPMSKCCNILAKEQGLQYSLDTMKPVRSDGSPLPWFTYPAIEYFETIDFSGFKIFEYGCGNSSLYWRRKKAITWSVDHNIEWYNEIRSNLELKDQLNIFLREKKSDYSGLIGEIGVIFDIIIIDGIWRNECVRSALPYLNPEGFIILDNSDWYTDVSDYLRSKGFFKIDFNGFGPCNEYCWTTSIFIPWKTSLINHVNHPIPIGGIKIEEKGDLW